MIRRIIAGVVMVAAIAACSSGRPAAQDTRHDPPSRSDTVAAVTGAGVPLTCDELHYRILKVPATRRSFAAEFGSPDSVIHSAEPNRHVAGAIDSLFTVFYPGFIMDIRTPPGARDMATHVRLDDNRYLAFPEIGIGATRLQLEQALGVPTDSAASHVTYDCSMAVEQPVTFRLTDGRVSRIEISYYVD